MCFRDDFIGGEEDRRRRRIRLICECRRVRRRGWDDDWDDDWDHDRDRFRCRCREI